MRALVFILLTAAAPPMVGTAVAQPITVTYGMAIAGLPIGSAKLVISPNGVVTAIAVTGSVGGPFEVGRMAAKATVADGHVTASSQSGSGVKATSAQLVSRGAPGDSSFTYSGKTERGPASVAMILAGRRVVRMDVDIPDNPTAVRAPVTEAHKSGVIDPVSLLALLVKPGGLMTPDGVCGRSHAVFTGQAHFTLAGTSPEPSAANGMPTGWTAIACRVTHTPVSGHRIDKNSAAAKARTGTVVFAMPPGRREGVLWSLSAPAIIGSFTLAATEVK